MSPTVGTAGESVQEPGTSPLNQAPMRTLRPAIALSVAASLLALPAAATADVPAPAGDGPGGIGDAVVIAVVDSGFSPYHQDMYAELMPQHLDGDPGTDLPLDTAPHEWLPGFPADPDEVFASYDEIAITRGDEDTPTAQLAAADADEWEAFTRTTTDGEDVHYRWLSDTKVIGAVDFRGSWLGTNDSHGAKVASVSTGTIHGSCPECLVVLVTYDASSAAARERASDWAMRQPWIDVVTNSYGYSTIATDKIYTGASLDVSRTAVERGQQVFYSAGNGQANAFTVPTSTYYSSQKSPDWVTAVGAVHPNGQAFMGAGKGVDIASVGIGYPSMGGTTVSSTATFSGTSNATPVSAGIYGRALWSARSALGGVSRVQAAGVVAAGDPVDCGPVVEECELGDGVLTRLELEHRFQAATTRTDAGLTISQLPRPGPAVTTAEVELASTGHGVFFGRLDNPITGEEFGAEHDRIVGPLLGTDEGQTITADTVDWMTVDSFCRQQAWGSWDQGYFTGTLPGPDPMWPTRTSLETGCPALSVVFGGGDQAAEVAQDVPVLPLEDPDER
jgi:hypothetical protein